MSHLEFFGSNIKIHIYFLLEKYMVIMFLNSGTELSVEEKRYIVQSIEEKLVTYGYEFDNFNIYHSRRILKKLRTKGRFWLKKLNFNYLLTHEHFGADVFRFFSREFLLFDSKPSQILKRLKYEHHLDISGEHAPNTIPLTS